MIDREELAAWMKSFYSGYDEEDIDETFADADKNLDNVVDFAGKL